MGVDVADVNGDGWLDVYVTNLGPNFLFINDLLPFNVFVNHGTKQSREKL